MPACRYHARYRYPYRLRSRGGNGGKVIGIAAGVFLAAAVSTHAAAHHTAGHSAATVVTDGSGAQTSTASANVALGQRLAASYGWGAGSQWACLDMLWTRESGWRMVWNYGGSGAFGIPQSLPASKMASAGPDYMTSPATQIRWGLGYIASTYGTPCGAWAHEEADSWY
jgi:hypothetical protein